MIRVIGVASVPTSLVIVPADFIWQGPITMIKAINLSKYINYWIGDMNWTTEWEKAFFILQGAQQSYLQCLATDKIYISQAVYKLLKF